MSDPSVKRRYEQDPPKEFRSTIPVHLLEKLSDAERYQVEALSKLENMVEWLQRMAVVNNGVIVDIGQRLDNLERQNVEKQNVDALVKELLSDVKTLNEWKTMMSGKWAVLWALLLVAVPVFLKYLFDFLLKHVP